MIAGRRAAARALVSEKILRGEVKRDLENLLNTIDLNSTQSLDGFEEAKSSILNFGIPDIVHHTIDEERVDDVVGEIAGAIRLFEPRLAERSIVVRRDRTVDPNELSVRFLVSGELVMSPENIPVEFVADLELNTGKLALNRL
ncbi:MAG: type VI secretion system baseplate subunit TssE [Siculibacillus sp.]|nr:type VI secretion system baseplate subunit TssE [Siculibacillus sp.]